VDEEWLAAAQRREIRVDAGEHQRQLSSCRLDPHYSRVIVGRHRSHELIGLHLVKFGSDLGQGAELSLDAVLEA